MSSDVSRVPVRVSDEDRERAATELREHFALGRLSADELADRLRRAYDARTDEELEALRADLPRAPGARPRLRDAPATRRLAQRTATALTPFAVCTLIWLASGAHGSFWPVWVAIAGLVVMLRGGRRRRRA